VASAEKQFIIKRTNEQLQATRTFYLNSIHAIPDNETKIISENVDLKIENNKLLVNLSKSNWKFRKELVETLADVDHLRTDLTNTILDKLHISKELDKVKKELDDILNKPTSEMGTQTDLTGEELKNFANDTLKGMETI
jgi:regulator of replication initiation timing